MKPHTYYNITNELDNYITRKHYRLVNSVLLYKDEKILIEQYYNKFTKESRNNLKSVWKGIIAICAGICLDKGYIKSLDDPVSDYIPVFDGRCHPYHKILKVKHLLTMTSGIYWNGGIHYHCPMVTQCLRSGNITEYISDIYMKDIPGTVFVYKEWDVMLASVLIQKASGMNTYDFCNEYVYKPLNIQSGRWFTSPDGVCYTIPGNNYNGINGDDEESKSDLSARDMAKIGILILKKGIYNGNRIISQNLAEQIITPSGKILGQEIQDNTKLGNNYGMFWWLGDNWYGAHGFGGQRVTVLPDQNIICVIQAKPTSSGKNYDDLISYLIELLAQI